MYCTTGILIHFSADKKYSVLPDEKKAAIGSQIWRIQHFIHKHTSQAPELSSRLIYNRYGLEVEVSLFLKSWGNGKKNK